MSTTAIGLTSRSQQPERMVRLSLQPKECRMSTVVHALLSVPPLLAYLLVGLLAFGESAALVGFVLPGETALLFGGLLAAQGKVSLPAMMGLGICAAVAGDSVGYQLGHALGPGLQTSRLGRRLGEQRWTRAQALLLRAGGRAVLLARFVSVVRALMPALAGMARMPYRTFLVWNAAGGLLWGGGFVLLGYLAGGSITTVERYLRLGWIPLALTASAVLLLRVLRSSHHRQRSLAAIKRAWGRLGGRSRSGAPVGADLLTDLQKGRRMFAAVTTRVFAAVTKVRALFALAVAVAVLAGVAACGAGGASGAGGGSATSNSAGGGSPPAARETIPTGDIADNVAYVAYQPPSGRYTIKTPEGWSRSGTGDSVTFTDKLNRVQVLLRPLAAAPTQASVGASELPAALGLSRGAGPVTGITTVTRSAGPAVLARYQADSPADPVTGKVGRDAVERYSFWKSGTEAVLTLSGPVGADNVDPYKTITDSFGWRP